MRTPLLEGRSVGVFGKGSQIARFSQPARLNEQNAGIESGPFSKLRFYIHEVPHYHFLEGIREEGLELRKRLHGSSWMF